jgi:hypothetical protein
MRSTADQGSALDRDGISGFPLSQIPVGHATIAGMAARVGQLTSTSSEQLRLLAGSLMNRVTAEA